MQDLVLDKRSSVASTLTAFLQFTYAAMWYLRLRAMTNIIIVQM